MLLRAASASFPTGYSGKGKKRGKKTKPKTTAFKQLLFTVCTEPSRQSIPLQQPSGPGATRTHTTETDGPRVPQQGEGGEQGRPGRCGAEVECRPGDSHSGAGGRGPESPCPQSWGAARSGDHLPPGPGAPSPGMRLERGPAWPHVPLAEPKCACFLLRPACGLRKPP